MQSIFISIKTFGFLINYSYNKIYSYQRKVYIRNYNKYYKHKKECDFKFQHLNHNFIQYFRLKKLKMAEEAVKVAVRVRPFISFCLIDIDLF